MIQSILVFAIAIAIVLLVLKVIGKSMKILIGILINGIVGFLVLTALSFIGLGVSVTIISALIVGLLGVPGLAIVLILQLVFGMPL